MYAYPHLCLYVCMMYVNCVCVRARHARTHVRFVSLLSLSFSRKHTLGTLGAIVSGRAFAKRSFSDVLICHSVRDSNGLLRHACLVHL
jgi:hypothetical protein